jgi:TIR domain-containing protein
MPFDVFISYAHADQATADEACSALEGAGIRCWIAPRDVRPGTEYGAAIVQAIDSCRAMVLIFSSNANASTQVRREIERAVSKNVQVLTVRIEAVAPTQSMEYFLGSIQWLDAFTPPFAKHLRHLTDAVETMLRDGSAAGGQPADAAPRQTRSPLAQAATRDPGDNKKWIGTLAASSGRMKWSLSGGLVALVLLVAGAFALRENPGPGPSPRGGGQAPATPLAPVCLDHGSLWDYDGATVFLQANSNDSARILYYCQGDLAGRVLFSGQRNSNRYEGTAYVISKKCGSFPYDVTGQVLNGDKTVLISGVQPQLDEATCKVSAHHSTQFEVNLRD